MIVQEGSYSKNYRTDNYGGSFYDTLRDQNDTLEIKVIVPFSILLNKKYLYIEVTGCNSYGDYRAKIDVLEIMEKNDSLAYLKAFEELCVSIICITHKRARCTILHIIFMFK